MGRFIWRSFILMIIFTIGLLIGNIFTPKQILQEKDIVGLTKVQTSLDLEAEDNFAALAQSQSIEEVYYAFLRQYYQKSKLGYEYQLQKFSKNPQDQKDFMKAQKNYINFVNYLEQNFPLIQESRQEDLQETSQENLQKVLPEILTAQIQTNNQNSLAATAGKLSPQATAQVKL